MGRKLDFWRSLGLKIKDVVDGGQNRRELEYGAPENEAAKDLKTLYDLFEKAKKGSSRSGGLSQEDRWKSTAFEEFNEGEGDGG
jgi:hypothetical protein